MTEGTFNILAEFKDHPGMFTILCCVIIICVFMTVSLPRVLKYMTLRGVSSKEITQKLDHITARIEYLEKHTTAHTSNEQDIKTELSIMIKESRDRDMRIAVLTLYNNNLPIWDRIDAALVYFSLGGNHNAEDHVVSMIMASADPQGAVRMWYDSVQKFTRKLPEAPLEIISNNLKIIRGKLA